MSRIDEVTFLRKLQRLLEEGDFVATYKFALLQALADLSVENEATPDGTLALTLDQLAEKFIEYYWRQARPFRDHSVLLQNMGTQAEVVSYISAAQATYDVPLVAARKDKEGWRSLKRAVASTIRKQPLWKLQIVAGQAEEFLYRRTTSPNGAIVLEPGVASCFRVFHPFIINIVRGAWVEHLLRIRRNRTMVGEQGDLSEFLFGSERRTLSEYRQVLRGHQSGRCFYCAERVRGTGELDHFIPWARYSVDLGHNFVFAHVRCNQDKRDYLADPTHLERWRQQNLDCANELANQFDDALLRHDARRSAKVAHWAYEQAELAKARVWVMRSEFRELGDTWRESLAGLSLLASGTTNV